MIRGLILLLFAALCAAPVCGQHGSPDAAFGKIPFDQWLGEQDATHIRWSASVARAELSFHQRLLTRVEIKIDGKDLEARRGDGQLVFFVQISASDGTKYQTHTSIELSKLDANIKSADLKYSQDVFVLPGDFRLAVALLDTATREHSTRQAQFRVAAMKHDLLPGAWRELPPVEFIGDDEPPDSWYLPDVQGRLQWAAAVHSPSRINVILNVAQTVPAPGARRSQGGGELAALLPTLKAMSQTGSPAISEHIAVLDLARRRVVFRQDEAHQLDWPRLKAGLGEASTASIDVHSLSDRHHDAQFFVHEVRNVVRAAKKNCVVVVLTAPVAFESGEDLTPISMEGLSACNVFYIRYRVQPAVVRPFEEMMGEHRGVRGLGGPRIRYRQPPQVLDQLENTLKPLSPKVFDLHSPEEVTRVFAEVANALKGAEP